MSIHELIRDVIADTTGDDLTVAHITSEVNVRIVDRDEALSESLPLLVRQVLASRRAGPVTPPPSTRVLPVRASAKVTGIRDWWRARLEETYSIGHEGQYKRLGDMTASDLDWLAGASERQARAQLARAAAWRRLGDLVQSEGVACVRDLPDEVLEETLNTAA